MPCVNPQIKAWNAIDDVDVEYVTTLINTMARGQALTSGFLAGELHGGPCVQRLEQAWAEVFKVKYAVAFNSGTSALLAASHAVGFSSRTNVLVPALSMSATAAAPAFLGAGLIWGDIDDESFCLQPHDDYSPKGPDGVILTNLFGAPAELHYWREFCDHREIPLIEDNCQAAFATHRDKYTGTWGDIGVFSLNVHKHMQTGEGGIAVTDHEALARRLRLFRNHGETVGDVIGLNLRMTELTAAMAMAQLSKGPKAVHRCRDLAASLNQVLRPVCPVQHDFPGNAYYAYPIIFPSDRDWWIRELQAEGVPISAGYGNGPLYRLPALQRKSLEHRPLCPNAEWIHDHLGVIELCAIDPTPEQIQQIGQAFQKVEEASEDRDADPDDRRPSRPGRPPPADV